VWLTSLVADRLETINDSGGGAATDIAVETKIVVGGPRTRGGWGGNPGSIHTDVCFDTRYWRSHTAAFYLG